MRCNKIRLAHCAALAVGICLAATSAEAIVVDFEDAESAEGATLTGANSYWNGSSRFYPAQTAQEGTFSSRGATFNNHFDEDYPGWPYWDCWSFSNRTYSPVPISPATDPWPAYKFVGGEFHAVPGSGADNSDTYGVGYVGWATRKPTVEMPEGMSAESAKLTNINYAFYMMRDGDQDNMFTDAFSRAENDYLKLTITGKDAAGAALGSVDFYLADFRADRPDNPIKDDYIVDSWATVDLSTLGEARSLEFDLTTSDVMLPTYFAMDSLSLVQAVPEPSTALMMLGGLLGLLAAGHRRRK